MSEKTELLPEENTKKTKSNKDDNIIYTSFLDTPDSIIEQVLNADSASSADSAERNQFILYDKKQAQSATVKTFTYQNKVFQPIVDDLLNNNVVLLPSGVEEYGETGDLINEILVFLKEYFEVPKFFESFLPYLILFYWVYEKFDFIPYVQFLGRTGTGKSTAMEVMGSICYKPIDASGAITVSSIFRVSSLWKGTLMLDEFNPGGESYSEMLSLLKSGVSNKAVLRVEGDNKREVKAYLVKSPKIFTSERPVNDAGFRSRIIEIKMEQNKRRIPLYRQNRFLEEAVHIRNKLLLWRLRNYDKVNTSEMEYGFEELRGFQGRVQKVISPIYLLADEKVRKEIVEFAKEQQEETLRERRDAIEGQIFEYIYDCYGRNLPPTFSAILEKFNKDTRYPISDKKLSSIIRKILGLSIEKLGHEKVSTVVFDNDEKMKELCEYYGLTFLPSARSAESAQSATDEEIQKIFDLDK